MRERLQEEHRKRTAKAEEERRKAAEKEAEKRRKREATAERHEHARRKSRERLALEAERERRRVAEAEQLRIEKKRKEAEQRFEERQRQRRAEEAEERKRIREKERLKYQKKREKERREYEEKLKQVRLAEEKRLRDLRAEADRQARASKQQEAEPRRSLIETLTKHDGKSWKKRVLQLRQLGEDLKRAGLADKAGELVQRVREEKHALKRIRKQQRACDNERCIRHLEKKVRALGRKQLHRISTVKKQLAEHKKKTETAQRAAGALREPPVHKRKFVKKLNRFVRRLTRLVPRVAKDAEKKVVESLKKMRRLLRRKRECNGDEACIRKVGARQKSRSKRLRRFFRTLRERVDQIVLRRLKRLGEKLKRFKPKIAMRIGSFLAQKKHALKLLGERLRACLKQSCRRKVRKTLRRMRRLVRARLTMLTNTWAVERFKRLVRNIKRLPFMEAVAKTARKAARKVEKRFRALRKSLRNCGRDKVCRKHVAKRRRKTYQSLISKMRELRNARTDAIVARERLLISRLKDPQQKAKLEAELVRNERALAAIAKRRELCGATAGCSRKKLRHEARAIRRAIRDGLSKSVVAVTEQTTAQDTGKLVKLHHGSEADQAKAHLKADEARLSQLSRYEKECDGSACVQKVREEMKQVRERMRHRLKRLHESVLNTVVTDIRSAIANLTKTRPQSAAAASAAFEKKLHSLREMERHYADCANAACAEKVRAEMEKVRESLEQMAERVSGQVNGTTSEKWREKPTVTDQLKRVIDLLRYVQPEIASAASYTLWEERHKLDRFERSKRDCESNTCFHAVLRKISHIKRLQKRELANLRHILNSGSSSVVRRIRAAIRELKTTHKTVAKEAKRKLNKLVRKVRKLWRKKWERKCHKNAACVTRVLNKVKSVWAQERLQLKELEKIVKGTVIKRTKDAVAALQLVDPVLAARALSVLSRHESQLANLTAAMSACRGNEACQEEVGVSQRRVESELKELLSTVRSNIPDPLGNVTHLVRQVGLESMADDADRQFFEEGKQLQRISMDRMDCENDDCVARLDLMEEKINAERQHRMQLLNTALSNAAPRSVVVTQDFPERTLLIVLVVVLSVLVLGLLVMLIALGGYWFNSTKKEKPRIERRPSSEWEWRET